MKCYISPAACIPSGKEARSQHNIVHIRVIWIYNTCIKTSPYCHSEKGIMNKFPVRKPEGNIAYSKYSRTAEFLFNKPDRFQCLCRGVRGGGYRKGEAVKNYIMPSHGSSKRLVSCWIYLLSYLKKRVSSAKIYGPGPAGYLEALRYRPCSRSPSFYSL